MLHALWSDLRLWFQVYRVSPVCDVFQKSCTLSFEDLSSIYSFLANPKQFYVVLRVLLAMQIPGIQMFEWISTQVSSRFICYPIIPPCSAISAVQRTIRIHGKWQFSYVGSRSRENVLPLNVNFFSSIGSFKTNLNEWCLQMKVISILMWIHKTYECCMN